jgi:hypothetical protein
VILQVDGTTTTINSTTLEVDDKNIELSKGAANKAASDGAGISIDLGTDGEANLTYGATDDIFNLNKGLNIAGQTQISSATFPPLSVERTTTATGSVIGVSRFLATTSGDMGDGFGGSISFQIKDNANVDNTLATIVGIRSGADNSGRLSLQTNNAGTQTEKMTILPNGNVLVGTNISPNDISVFSVDKLSVVGNLTVGSGTGYIRPNTAINGPGGAIRLNASNTTTDQFLAFGINATGGSINFTERMRVTSNGNVGIGTTSPAEPLTVRGNVRSQSTAESSTNIITRAFSDGASTRYGVVEAFRDTVGSLPLLLNPSGGNVGIGETNLNETVSKLHIKGNVNISVGYLRWNNGNAQIDGQDTNLKLSTWTGSALTEKMRITGAGNVGIGTTSPSTVLNLVTQSNTDGIQIRRNSNTSGEYGLLSFRIATSESAVNYAEIRAIRTDRAVAQDTDLVLLTRSNSAVTERLRIRDDGLVGIGETSPTAQLVVKSGATNRIPLIVDSLTGQTADLQRWLINGSNISKLDSLGAWYGYGVYNLANGNNGFLRLADTGATISRNIADTNPALIVNLANASATGNIQVWQKAGVAKAVIDNGGYFSGTGVYNLSSSANAVIFLNNTGTEINRNVNDANVVLKVKQQNVSATGDLQQWIYGTNTYAYVDKDGDFYNSSGSYGQISDLRVKENIVEARDYTEDLMKLRVVKYSLKKDQEQEATKLGFIAQEVEEVFPNMVQTTKTEELEDMKSIKMSVLIPMLVKTIQEQEKRIKELEAKIK